jgi:hypothetical protein
VREGEINMNISLAKGLTNVLRFSVISLGFGLIVAGKVLAAIGYIK